MTRKDFDKVEWNMEEISNKLANGDVLFKTIKVENPERYVEYCMGGCPSASMFMDVSNGTPYSMIDGGKRLRTLNDFMNGKFSLENGSYFEDLSSDEKNALRNYKFRIDYVKNQSTAEKIIKYITEKA